MRKINRLLGVTAATVLAMCAWSAPVSAAPLCWPNIWTGSRCVTLEEWLQWGDVVLAAPRTTEGVAAPRAAGRPNRNWPVPLSRDQREKFIRADKIVHGKPFIDLTARRDFRGMINALRDTDVDLAPMNPQLWKICKPPTGTPAWGWVWTNDQTGVFHFVWGEICVGSTSFTQDLNNFTE